MAKSEKVKKIRKPRAKREKVETLGKAWLIKPETWSKYKAIAGRAIADVVLKSRETALKFSELLTSRVAGNVEFGEAAYAVQFAIGMSGGKKGEKRNLIKELAEKFKINIPVKKGKGDLRREVPVPADTAHTLIRAVLMPSTPKGTVPETDTIRAVLEQIRRASKRYANSQNPKLPLPVQERGRAAETLANTNAKSKIGRVFVNIGATAATRQNLPFDLVEQEKNDAGNWVPLVDKKGMVKRSDTLLHALYASLADEDRIEKSVGYPLSEKCAHVGSFFIERAKFARDRESKAARQAGAGAVPQPAEVMAKAG